MDTISLENDCLNELVCHFNWDIVSKHKTEVFYNDRIELVQFDLSDEGKRNIPQRYCLLGYLQAKAYDLDYGADNGESAFLEALNNLSDTSRNLGYRIVVLGNLVYHYNKIKDYEQVRKYHTEYNDIKNNLDPLTYENAEVLAMKAFALSYVWKHEEAMNIYNDILKAPENRNTPEWIIGLVYAKDFHLFGRDSSKFDNDEIQIFLRRVIELDPLYHYAILKLAKHLKKTQGIKHIEEIKYLIDKVLGDETAALNVKVESAILLQQLPNFEDQGASLLKELDEKNLDFVKIKRALARHYHEAGKKNFKKNPAKSKESFEKSIEYYNKISNQRHFDKCYIASTYDYLQKLDEENSSNYQEKIQTIHKYLLRNCEKELPRGQIQIYYNYAFQQMMSKNHPESYKYFKEAVSKAAKFSKEELFGDLHIVKKAENFLLGYATDMTFLTQVQALELKGWIQLKRRNYDSAIFYQQKAIFECAEKRRDCDELEVALVGYFLERSKNRMRINFLNHLSNEDFFADTITKIKNLPDSCSKKWDFDCEVNTILMDEMLTNQHLIKLKEYMRTFEIAEKCRRQRNKKIEEDIILDVICECKSLLDSHISDLMIKFGKDPLNDSSKRRYFTSFKEGITKQNMAKKIKERFERKFGLTDFSRHYLELFNFLVINLHPNEIPWLDDLIVVRNANEHCRTEVKGVLAKKFPEIKNQISVVRQASRFTAQVWILTEKGGKAMG